MDLARRPGMLDLIRTNARGVHQSTPWHYLAHEASKHQILLGHTLLLLDRSPTGLANSLWELLLRKSFVTHSIPFFQHTHSILHARSPKCLANSLSELTSKSFPQHDCSVSHSPLAIFPSLFTDSRWEFEPPVKPHPNLFFSLPRFNFYISHDLSLPLQHCTVQ